MLVEGPAGVGKTELAKAISRATGRPLIRLQCYEGLDEAKALYEWNYRKQLLRIQAERAERAPRPAATEATPKASRARRSRRTEMGDIFSEEFLLTRPLLQAIAATEPVVLLIDEIDKTDQEFEAMLLEVLSDFQISIPELGVIEARTHPIVVLTSNNSRELTEALKRRCLYLWLDYPEVEREMEIVRLHSPEIDEQLARRLVEVVHMVRQLDLKKPPSIAESIDWARALLLLGADDLDASVFERTMSIIVKHRTDMDLVAERVGVKLGGAQLGCRSRRLSGLPPGLAPRVVAFCDELRREGLAVGTSEILDAFAALETVPWEQEDDFREALAATVAKSQEDRRVFELLFDRFFFRAAEREALGRGIGEGRRYEGGERLELDELREAVRQAIAEGRDGEMRDLARLAISAFGRRGEGSGVIGVDVQRIRRTLGLQAQGGGPRVRSRRWTASRSTASNATCAASSSGR